MGRVAAPPLLALAIVLVATVGASAQVEVSAVSDRQTASPGDFVTAVFEVRNAGGSPTTFDLELDLPAGLIPLAPPRSVTLAPGESERLFISVNVTNRAEAGANEITLTAIARDDAGVRDSAAVVVEIEAQPSLAINPPGAHQVLPGEAATLTFEVVNRGNVIDRAVLEARSLRGFGTEVTPSSAELLPGESISVDVRVAVPDDAEPGRDRVRLTARSARFETETSVTADLTVLPPSPREVSRDLSLSVPSVWRISETTTDDDPIDATSVISGDALFGEGSRFSYRVEAADPFRVETLRAQLERPRYGIALGDLSVALGELIGLDGRGVRLAVRRGLNDASGATVASARDLDTGEGNVGARAALQGSNWLASLAGRRRTDIQASVVGVSLLRLPVTDPALRVDGAFSRHAATADSAFVVRGDAERPPFVVDAELVRAGPNFLGTISDELRVSLRPGLRFDDAEANGVFQWERDGLGTAPAQTGTSETRVGANARLAIDPLPVVTAQVDYELASTLGTPKLTDSAVFTAEVRASKTFGPLTLAAHVLREVNDDRLAGTRIERSGWRTEAELRLPGALLLARLGMTTDVDADTGAIGERTLTALLSADWDFDAFEAGFSVARDRGETRFAADVDGDLGRWSWATDGSVTLDDDDPNRFRLNLTAGLDFTLPVSFIKVNGQVEGHVFVDANGNGIRDADEPGVSGLSLELDGAQARTDADGFYRFPPTEPGTYELALGILPATLERSSEGPRRVTLAAGQRRTVNVPLVPVASVRVTAFDDADEDGRQDADETGLRGVRIQAVGPDERTRGARTGAQGTATLRRLTPGRWRVAVVTGTLPERFELTTPGERTVAVEPGEQAEVAFGAVERAPEVQFSPTADFSVRPAEPTTGEPVTFDGSASFDPDGAIRSFEWDVDGDGAVDATGETVEHVYTSSGTFAVTLTVTDDDGRTGSRTRTLEVSTR